MISNLKVDIIYYKTSSDFELEFNLSGCCRMRIFKEKVEERRALVSSLARDVSRSRVILIITDLVGEKNGVQTVCAAIGYKYVPVDKAAAAIKSDEDIRIPHGALPLVTKSGQYGGCIVECGKQSIIMVSSDRALRHEIMRSYIHQYIFDVNQLEAYNERLRHESGNNPVLDQSNILNNARKEIAEELGLSEGETVSTEEVEESVEADADTETVTEAAISDDNSNETADVSELDTETEDKAAESFDEKTETENNDISSVSAKESGQDDIASFAEPDIPEKKLNKRHKRRGKGTNIALLIVTILLLLGFGILAYYFVYLPIITGQMPNDLSSILEAFR